MFIYAIFSGSGSWLANNVAKRQHDAIHQTISTTCLIEQECYDALWSYLTWQYEIDFVCNPEKRDQIIADVEKRKQKLLENAGLCRREDCRSSPLNQPHRTLRT